jgi:hypothetical protein
MPGAEGALATGEADEQEFLLATLPRTAEQQRLALGVAFVLIVAFVLTVPVAAMRLPRVNAFIPAMQGIVCVNDFITAVLLFSQFSMSRSRALLILASGYLYVSLIAIPHSLTFPGAFSPTGLLGAGLQSTAWLYMFWHIGFATALLAYAWLKGGEPARNAVLGSAVPAILWSAGTVFGIVCGVTWLSIAGEELLPRFFLGNL